jgi:hypothetical protein
MKLWINSNENTTRACNKNFISSFVNLIGEDKYNGIPSTEIIKAISEKETVAVLLIGIRTVTPNKRPIIKKSLKFIFPTLMSYNII